HVAARLLDKPDQGWHQRRGLVGDRGTAQPIGSIEKIRARLDALSTELSVRPRRDPQPLGLGGSGGTGISTAAFSQEIDMRNKTRIRFLALAWSVAFALVFLAGPAPAQCPGGQRQRLTTTPSTSMAFLLRQATM